MFRLTVPPPASRLPLLGSLAVLLVPVLPLHAARTAYYQFDDAANPGLDSAGGDDQAAVDGGTRVTAGTVAGSGAWQLDGKTPGFTITPSTAVDGDFNATEGFSVSAWFKVSAASGRQRIFSCGSWGLAVDYTGSTGLPRLLMTAYGHEDKFFDAPELITGKWYQMTVVVHPADGENTVYTHIYLNGQAYGVNDGIYRANSGNLLIGSAGGGFEGFNGVLDELAYYDAALTGTEVQDLYDAVATDTDGDGMPDFFENAYGLNAGSAQDEQLDLDADGVSNRTEYDEGLIPNNPDSDGDGLKDGVEDRGGIYVDANETGTDPKNPDSDGDTIPDGAEMAVGGADLYATDPTKWDSDDDLIPDNYEIFIGRSDPTDPSSPAPVENLVAEYRFELPERPGLDSAGGDDNGTVAGGTLVRTGALSGTGAYALNGTTAGLSIGSGSTQIDPDFSAVENFSISVWVRVGTASGRQRILCGTGWGMGLDFSEATPRVLMTTFGVEDKFFPAPELIAGKWAHIALIVRPQNEGGVVMTEAWLNGTWLGENDGPYTRASNLGIGSGGAGSNAEAFNGLLDELRVYHTALTPEMIEDLVAVGSLDEDGDGLPANWELTYGLDPNDPADAAGDLDGDSLTNLHEYTNGLLPDNKDTDGDGFEDGHEDKTGVYLSATQTGTNPQKPDTDGDGIPDGAEKAMSDGDPYSTDPNLPDTDGDYYPDGYEVTVLNTDPTNPADPDRPPGLVARYDFEDPANPGFDSQGGDDNAVPVGFGFQVTDDVKTGSGAFSLGGTDYLRIGQGNLLADIDFRATTRFSAAVWFKSRSSTGRQRILSGWPGWGLGLDFSEAMGGRLLLTAFGVVDSFYTAAIVPDQWHHLAFSVDIPEAGKDPLVLVYLDGAEVGRSNFRFNPATNFSIGSMAGDGTGEAFTGLVDDLRYYNSTITPGEVAALAGVSTGDPSFRITSLTLSGGRMTLTFPSEAGAGYTIQRSETLSGWQPAGTVTADGPGTTWTEPAAPPAPAFGRWFYRVVKN